MTLNLFFAEKMRLRATIVQTVRQFFIDHDFIEVDTPVALTAPAPEAHLEAPAVWFSGKTQARQQRFLQTSPELRMKRILAQGLPRIFQIAAAFRDGDYTRLHRPEFRLLEWYRLHDTWETLLSDCEELFSACAQALEASVRFGGKELDLSRPFLRISMDEAFIKHVGFSILDAMSKESLAACLQERGIHFDKTDTWDELFHRVFLSVVEPALVACQRPFFLTHFPAPLAALARLSKSDNRVSERFEFYVQGIELANGFGELTDATEQRQRFVEERALRQKKGMNDYPLDERFLQSLDSLGEAAGIALGLDRLILILLGENDLDAVSALPWSET